MQKYTLKRVVAYIVDLILIGLITSMISQVKLFNPKFDDYNKYIEQYSEKYEDLMNMASNNSSFLEEEITEVNDLAYQVSNSSIVPSIICIVVTLLYYICFQYFANGMTAGQYLLKIKVVGEDNKKPALWQLVIRTLIIYGSLGSIVDVVLLSNASKEFYLEKAPVIQMTCYILIMISFAFMVARKDGKGLHDLVANTNVVSSKTSTKEAKVIETKGDK